MVTRLNIIFFSVILCFSAAGCLKKGEPQLKFERMLVEYAEDPVNIDMMHPRFSWIITSVGRGRRQSEYRISVSSTLKNLISGKYDLWDSGRIQSGETIQHEYVPDNLESNSIYFWKVTICDEEGRSFESQTSKFSTALLPGFNWSASWIGSQSSSEKVPGKGFYTEPGERDALGDTIIHDGYSLLLRHEIYLGKKVMSARAFITGLGYYGFFINGNRVGDHLLAPAKTPYHKYVLYDTYDVTSFLKEGQNAFGIDLGNGWYNPYKKWWNIYRMQWFGSKKAIAEIHIQYTDGTSGIIRTDSSWLWSHGPLKYNCVYDGEIYDANAEKDGWTTPGFNDPDWKHVSVFSNYNPRLASHRMSAIRGMEHFKAREVKGKPNGVRVFDMGQNFAGWIRLKARGNKNCVIKINFAEDLLSDSTLDVTSNENAGAAVEYIMKSDQPEIYEPRFTFFGFRYVGIKSVNGPLEIIDLEGQALYSDNRRSGQFECSDSLVNKIHNATVWSQKSNMLGYPMDCPQRDERLGWLGDAQVTAEEAMFNFDMALFYENWLDGIMENQDEKSGDLPIISPRPYIKDDGIEWSSTYILMLWQYYSYYGDKRILAHHYNAMRRYMNYLDSLSDGRILPAGWIGDWGSMADGWKEGEPASVPSAYYYKDAIVMSDIAALLDMTEESKYFMDLASDIRNKFNKTFLDTLTANYCDGSQMANSFPIFLGMVPERLRQGVIANLVNDIVVKHKNHLTTGVLGTKYMPEALAMEGLAGIVWDLIKQKSPPCWNDMVKRYDTMCEFWTLKQSKNHVMMGSIDAWFYKYIAGIQIDPAGVAFSSFRIKPFIPDSLNSATATIETIRGKISVHWEKRAEGLSLAVEIPFNTTAEVNVPGNSEDVVEESGKALKEAAGTEYLGYDRNCHIIRVSSGNYEFTTQDSRLTTNEKR